MPECLLQHCLAISTAVTAALSPHACRHPSVGVGCDTISTCIIIIIIITSIKARPPGHVCFSRCVCVLCARGAASQISRDLDSLATSDLAIQRAKLDQSCTPAAAQQFQIHPTDEPSLHNVGLVPAIEAECRTWVTRTIERSEPADFHDDEHYRRMIKETCELPRLALGKVQIWLEDSASLAWHIKRMTLTEADRHACGIWTRRLHGAASTQAKGLHLLEECGVAAALHMCRMQGLVVSSPTEVIDAASGETMLMRQAVCVSCACVRVCKCVCARSRVRVFVQRLAWAGLLCMQTCCACRLTLLAVSAMALLTRQSMIVGSWRNACSPTACQCWCQTGC